MSAPLRIARGVRQGSPLSPILFDLVIESLANGVRHNEQIRGIRSRSIELKLSLYSDNVVGFFTGPIPIIDQSIRYVMVRFQVTRLLSRNYLVGGFVYPPPLQILAISNSCY